MCTKMTLYKTSNTSRLTSDDAIRGMNGNEFVGIGEGRGVAKLIYFILSSPWNEQFCSTVTSSTPDTTTRLASKQLTSNGHPGTCCSANVTSTWWVPGVKTTFLNILLFNSKFYNNAPVSVGEKATSNPRPAIGRTRTGNSWPDGAENETK